MSMWKHISWIFLLFVLPFSVYADATFEIPYTLGETGEVACDIPLNTYNASISFYSYSVTKDDAILTQKRTSGKSMCQNTFIASTSDGGDLRSGAGRYMLTLYAESDFRDPYGYMVFDCPESGVCTPIKLTNVKTWYGTLDADTTWQKSANPYYVDQLIIKPGVTLSIEPGVRVEFRNKASFIYIESGATLDVQGASGEQVLFTSINPTKYPGDWDNIQNYGTLKATHLNLEYSNTGIVNQEGGESTIDQSTFAYNRVYAVQAYAGVVSITNSSITHGDYGVYTVSADTKVFNSIISDHAILGANNIRGVLNAVNNYWGDASGPHLKYSNTPSGTGEDISEGISYMPFLTEAPTEPKYMDCVTDCFSNILFLPGLEGSRLYTKAGEGSVDCGISALNGSDCFYDEELWLSRDDDKQAKLSLDAFGKSIHDVYTQFDIQKSTPDEQEYGILDDAYGVNIYDSFLEQLAIWKNAGLYADYAFIPYDWRLSLQDIVDNARITQVPNGRLSYTQNQSFTDSVILKQLEKLQATSRTGKVSIIAHSNGGLVAKALVERLRETNHPLYSKIEQIILVATPQSGTPEATMLLTHGVKLFKGILMSNERARAIAENMPSAYHLLPSLRYFEMVDTDKNPLITFEDHPLLSAQVSKYANKITTHSTMDDYLLGGDGRAKPEYGDTKNANISNPYLMSYADDIHTLVDNWQPHQNTKIVEIAGWGEETLAGLDYVVRKKFLKGDEVTYKPRWVIDGDGVVVAPSAFATLNNPNLEEWYVDLLRYNKNKIILPNTDHKNILEVPNLVNLIYQKIQRNDFNDNDGVVFNNNLTFSSNEPRLHFTLHSPLALGVRDGEGRYTGLDPVTLEIKHEIPGVRYERVGEVQFISLPKGLALTLVLDGLSSGSFALDIDEQTGDEVTDSLIFEGIPSNIETFAKIEIGESFDVGDALLEIDENGDGDIDITLSKKDNMRVVYEEPKQTEPVVPEPTVNPPPAVVPVWLLDTIASVLPTFEVSTLEPVAEPEVQNTTEIEEASLEIYLYENQKEESVVEESEVSTNPEPPTDPTPSALVVEESLLPAAALKSDAPSHAIWYILGFLALVLFGLKFIRR